jgi:hypothetical protein
MATGGGSGSRRGLSVKESSEVGGTSMGVFDGSDGAIYQAVSELRFPRYIAAGREAQVQVRGTGGGGGGGGGLRDGE